MAFCYIKRWTNVAIYWNRIPKIVKVLNHKKNCYLTLFDFDDVQFVSKTINILPSLNASNSLL